MNSIFLKRLGPHIISIGTLLNIIGAILNSFHIKYAFLLWIFSNSLCAAYFYGASEEIWIVEKTDDRKMLLMYIIFMFTATLGWII